MEDNKNREIVEEILQMEKEIEALTARLKKLAASVQVENKDKEQKVMEQEVSAQEEYKTMPQPNVYPNGYTGYPPNAQPSGYGANGRAYPPNTAPNGYGGYPPNTYPPNVQPNAYNTGYMAYHNPGAGSFNSPHNHGQDYQGNPYVNKVSPNDVARRTAYSEPAYKCAPMHTPASRSYPATRPHSNTASNSNSEKLEMNLGKNVMSVLASILIFIGIASFLRFASNSELARLMICVCMNIFCFAIVGVGLWRVKKEKNTFSLAISGCGMGAVYISTIMTSSYFGYIESDLLLFGLLIAWSAVVLLLSQKFKADLFVLISYIGFVVSLGIGANSKELSFFGSTIAQSAIMVLLHTAFYLLIGSGIMKVGEKLYKYFPIMHMAVMLYLGSQLTVQLFEGFEPFVYLVLAANVLQMISMMYYIYKLNSKKIM